MKKAVLIALVLLQGCAFSDFFRKKENDQPIIQTHKEVRVDPRILEPCPPLVQIDPKSKDFESVLINVRANVEVYKICASKQANSVTLIKELANITGETK